MLLYLITRPDAGKFTPYDERVHDIFTSAVVIADSPETARHIHPGSKNISHKNTYSLVWVSKRGWLYSDELDDPTAYAVDDWIPPENVVVKLLGVAVGHAVQGVVVASYSAG
jgi:hypothetical protein